MLTPEQYRQISSVVKEHMKDDEYGETTIQSLYYDTDTWLLIRNSIEKPVYKEKLRVRSYGRANADSTVFVELKKKSNKIVFKRRISLKEKDVESFFEKENGETQIEREILYFLDFYGKLSPKMLLLYDRVAFKAKVNGDLRITFDRNIRYRKDDLDLCSPLTGIPLTEEGMVMMEIKTGYAYPKWLTDLLSKQKAYKTSFSKYGNAYKQVFMEEQERKRYIQTEAEVV